MTEREPLEILGTRSNPEALRHPSINDFSRTPSLNITYNAALQAEYVDPDEAMNILSMNPEIILGKYPHDLTLGQFSEEEETQFYEDLRNNVSAHLRFVLFHPTQPDNIYELNMRPVILGGETVAYSAGIRDLTLEHYSRILETAYGEVINQVHASRNNVDALDRAGMALATKLKMYSISVYNFDQEVNRLNLLTSSRQDLAESIDLNSSQIEALLAEDVVNLGSRRKITTSGLSQLARRGYAFAVKQLDNLGGLFVVDFGTRQIFKEEIDLMQNIAYTTGSITGERMALAEARSQALTDKLTGIHNRRYLDEETEKLIDESIAQGFPVSMVMFDIDKFKLWNDQHGHDQGDIILRRVAQRIKSLVKEGDILGKYGGEEIGLVIKGNAELAAAIAERVRSTIEFIESQSGETIDFEERDRTLTISAGVVETSLLGIHTLKEIYGAASDAVHRAKDEGRNRVYQTKDREDYLQMRKKSKV